LDASLALVAADGAAALSVREAARRAGVSHQAPYHYFKDREAILAALAEDGFQQLLARMRAAIARADTPLARLEGICLAYIGFAVEERAYFQLMFRGDMVGLERHPEANAAAEAAFGVLVSLLEEIAPPPGVDRDALVMTTWSFVHGAATLLIEGKMNKRYPNAREQCEGAARAVMNTYTALLRQHLRGAG
jgi:AcrR family transcriptional regulator